jgi:hypothetical protein
MLQEFAGLPNRLLTLAGLPNGSISLQDKVLVFCSLGVIFKKTLNYNLTIMTRVGVP